MKKLIAVLAVLGIFSLTTMALPLPDATQQAAGNQDMSSTLKMQKTSLAMQVAISEFATHAQENSFSEDEDRIAEVIMDEGFMNQLSEIQFSFTQEIAKLENVEVNSDDEAEAILEQLGNTLLGKLKGNESLVKITNLLMKNQKAYPVKDLDFEVALSFTYQWALQMYGLAE